MKIIAIDSSGLVATVAVLEDDQLIAEYTVNYKKTHSQTLLPMLDEIKKMTELDLSTVDAIAIANGPGSFTGLRIGSATAKGLGLALDIPLIEVPTVDALSINLWGVKGIVCPMMDARREQVYTGLYEFVSEDDIKFDVANPKICIDGYMHRIIVKQCAVPVCEIIDKINETGKSVTFLGDGVPVYKGIIEESVKVPFKFAPANASRQRAASFGVLAMQYLKEGRTVSAAKHSPDYLRKSQAEREREDK